MERGQSIRDLILEDRIGGGGVGEVWRARHRHLQKVVAIKAIYKHLDQDPQFFERFVQEAVGMARLEHPHIAAVHDFFFEEGVPFLIMSYIPGDSLEGLIRDRAPLSVSEALRISRQILGALDYAHRQGVVHRDVKPSNILVREDGEAFLVDFGIALVLGRERKTRFGTNVGTPEYMSPEQIRGGEMDNRTDVYSFGCVLYEMLAGHPPFGSQDEEELTEFQIMNGHVNNPPPSLGSRNPHVERRVEEVVFKALAKKPDDRFPDCESMAKALVRAAGEHRSMSEARDGEYGSARLAKSFAALSIVLAGSTAYATYEWLSSTREPISVEETAEFAQLSEKQAVLEAENAKYQESLRTRAQGFAMLEEQLLKVEESLAQCRQDLQRCPGQSR